MAKITDEQLKKELAFDQYGRYAITRDVINTNRKNGEKFRVLDVGGRGNIMRKFLPEDKVFYLDPHVDTNDDNYIEGDGCEMPLDDNSYDWVVSADVFEHIPEGKRKGFLEENLRVAKLGVLLMAPFYTKEVRQAEMNANESYKIISKGNDHIWLKEHIQNELPNMADFENILEKKEVSFQKMYNNRLFLWQTLIGISFLVSENFNDDIKKEFEKFNYFYNTEVFPFDNQEPAYRKIYFIKKNHKLKDLKISRRSIDDELFLKTIKKGLDLVNKINVKNKDFFQQKDQAIQQKDSELQQKDQAIQQKATELQQKDQAIQQKDQTIQLEEHLIQQKDSEIQKKDAEIAMMKSSKFWKLRDRYIRIKSVRPKHIASLAKKGYDVFEKKGTKVFFWSLYKYILHGRGYFKTKSQLEKTKTDYEQWMKKNENWDKEKIEEKIKNFKYKPKISIITPVYNVDSKWLDKCIESVRNQFYENWELCLHDDASTKEETIKCLKKWEKKGDKRIKISFGKENQHISGASNEALKLATGEFIALLDNDDELSPDALFENVKILNQHSDADFIYSDEDKLEIDGKRVDPFFKPDWSPDLFLSLMYTCHLGVYRKSIVDEINGFKKGYEGSQDHDLVLRLMEKTDRRKILHIPKILYHWRKIIGSMAGKETAKGYASVTAKKALRDYLKRNNVKGEVLDGEYSGIYRVKRDIVGNPLVSIAIPFKDEVKVTRVCVNSVLTKTDYENFEILLVDNQSAEKKTMEYLESVKGNPKIRILEYNKPFNYSAINNFAVKRAKGEYIVFLNNDTEVISDGWLSAMLEHAQRKEVGAVGAKLLYPNNNIQHAGVIMGMGVAGHAFKYLSSNNHSYFSQLHTIKNYCSVTGACMMIRKKLFEDIGGLDEKNLSISFNDVDICLRLIEEGYYNVYTPYAELYHYESLSRGSDADKDLEQKNPEKYRRAKSEDDYMKKKWAKYIKNDPFYNPNLTKTREDFSIEIG